jgi:prepilin-type N-terminal cleavage/methylation domain-containing protein
MNSFRKIHGTFKPAHKVRGFTIVEMMVALALFTIVMTIATGAFLSLIGGSSQLQGEQTIMTSLKFERERDTIV